MSIIDYEDKFHAFSHDVTELLSIEDDRLQFFVKGMDTNLQVLFVHMTFVKKIFSKAAEFMKKVEVVKQVVRQSFRKEVPEY